MRHTRLQFFCLMLTALLLLLSACGPEPTPALHHPLPWPAPPRAAAAAPYQTVQFCDDVSSSYPRAEFDAARRQVADWVDQLPAPNEAGATVYVTLVTYNSFMPESTVQTIHVPPLTAPLFPRLQGYPSPPTRSGANQFDLRAWGTTVADYNRQVDRVNASNQQALADYRQSMAQFAAQLAQVRAKVNDQTSRMRALAPPVDDVATDLWGCIARASDRLSGASGTKHLIIASDMENNTLREWTASHPLPGVHVLLLDYVCVEAAACAAKTAAWKEILMRAGATSFQAYDPSQLPANPFI